MIYKYPLTSCYTISDFEPHLEIKSKVLELLEQTAKVSSTNKTIEHIHGTDWYTEVGESRKYMDFLSPMIVEHMNGVMENIGINMEQGYSLKNVWFNEYKTGDYSDWHRHIGTNWACVYYLHLDSEEDATLLRSPYDGSEIQPKVKEGQILTMPSHIYHKCQPTKGDKIVIAFNIS